jgi:hypothetical protein
MNTNIDIFILVIQIGAPYICYRVVFAQWTNWYQLTCVLPKIEMEMIEQCNFYRIVCFSRLYVPY